MFRVSPLADCTRDTIQSMNQMHESSHHCIAAVKMVKTTRHNPYASKLLAPEDSVEYNSILTSPLSGRHSPLNWEARAFEPSCAYSNLGTPYITQSLASVSVDAQVHRSLFGISPTVLTGGKSPSDASTELSSTHPQSIIVAAASAASAVSAAPPPPPPPMVPEPVAARRTVSPAQAMGKVHLGGRPVAVPRHGSEVTVRLRSGEISFVIPDLHALLSADEETRDIIGLPVIVEGDRGEDYGVIAAVPCAEAAGAATTTATAAEEEEETAAAKESHGRPAKPLLKVLRVASAQEVRSSEALPQREAEALEYCQSCLQEVRLAVPIHIDSVIFQFDRKKLTVRYTSESYVDFNDLTRMLHKKYNCRIWMDQLNRDAVAGAEKRSRRSEHGGRKSNAHHRGSQRRREQ
ncbi:PSP1 C-terminal conserved region containing protein [Novymonas esmeraldas]|uniref:PSP1 C-terminal conserved region containing protein n=1 Tax=Novymonas esmeraldas TaxID=1808958 RepID=A0AAW0ERN0_9TRYP